MSDQVIKYDEPVDIWDHLFIAMSRPKHELAKPPSGLKVQLGAGFKHIDGWLNLDYPDWEAGCGLPFNDATVSEIACYHTLDHLTPEDVLVTIKEVQRALVPGGTFVNILPHYSSQLANECLMHKSRFAIDTWRNLFSERQYDGSVDGRDHKWRLDIQSNFIYGITERNLVLVTQLVKR